VLAAPDSPLGARRDFAAVLPATVLRNDADGIAVVDVAGSALLLLAPALEPGDAVRIRIPAGDVSIARQRHPQSSILNSVPAKVMSIEALDEAEASIRLDIGRTTEAPIRARITRRSLQALDLREGETVVAQIKGVSLAANR